jgi:diguanylate cyclase (GGDEF)-like protein
LILFISIGERVYLYYVLYVTSFATIWIARTGFVFQYLWPNHPAWDVTYRSFVGAAAIIFSALFVREFLATGIHSPRADLVLRGSIGLVLLLCVATAGNLPLLPVLLSVIGLALCVLYASIGLMASAKGYRAGRFFLLAWAALLVGNIVYILMYLRILPLTVFTHNAAQAGSAIESVLLAFALADRVDLLKRAREEKQLLYTSELQEQVNRRTGELTAAVEKLRTASSTDPLTGLSNRRHVDAAVRPWLADLQRSRIRNSPEETLRYLAICLADLDHFKQINDQLGHAAGDKVLQLAAETLRNNVRATAILARWGGEEFLILDHVAAPYEDLLMAERLRRSIIESPLPHVSENGQSLSLSLGVVRYPFSESFPDLLDWDHCLALADHALYRAKKIGRNCWQCYRPNEEALESAIEERGEDDIRRLLRLHADDIFELGLVEVVNEIPRHIEFA